MQLVVSTRCRDPKLLAISTLRSKLGLPLVQRPRPHLQRRPPDIPILRRNLGTSPRHLRLLLQIPFLDSTPLRHRTRCP